MKRRKYDQEFKRDAVEMVIRSGKSATEVGKAGFGGHVSAGFGGHVSSFVVVVDAVACV